MVKKLARKTFTSTALNKTLEDEELRNAYAEANVDPDRNEVIYDWEDI